MWKDDETIDVKLGVEYFKIHGWEGLEKDSTLTCRNDAYFHIVLRRQHVPFNYSIFLITSKLGRGQNYKDAPEWSCEQGCSSNNYLAVRVNTLTFFGAGASSLAGETGEMVPNEAPGWKQQWNHVSGKRGQCEAAAMKESRRRKHRLRSGFCVVSCLIAHRTARNMFSPFNHRLGEGWVPFKRNRPVTTFSALITC